jgi:hypothetical protein
LLQCIATAPVVAGAKRNELGSQTPQSTSRRLVLQVRPCTDKWSRWTGRMRRYPGGGRGRASRRAVVRPVRRSVPSAPRRIVSLSSSPTRAAGSTSTSGNATASWRPWTGVSEGSTTPGGTISAVVTAANNIALFLADSAGGVYTTSGSADAGWRPWTRVSEGRSTPGAPITALVAGPSRLTLFLADPAGGVYTTSGNAADGWRPWTSVAEGRSTPGGTISAVLIAPKRVALFLADSEGGIYATELQLS